MPVVLLTHPAREKAVRAALARIEPESFVAEATRLLRAEMD